MQKHSLVLVGGTFGPLHAGHELLLGEALKRGKKVCVGITSDKMARQNKEAAHKIPPEKERMAGVLKFFESNNAKHRAELCILTDIYGPAALTPKAEAIVVTKETRANAEKINLLRARQDPALFPLKIYVVKKKLAWDGAHISSTRIRKGEIGRDGKLLKEKPKS
ncbi:MAG: pantetheine-phosphate adenylyltransferase [Candidatus Micrarchaeia archaeon]|jgi:pantetheine-phosphate adenylyltransferase